MPLLVAGASAGRSPALCVFLHPSTFKKQEHLIYMPGPVLSARDRVSPLKLPVQWGDRKRAIRGVEGSMEGEWRGDSGGMLGQDGFTVLLMLRRRGGSSIPSTLFFFFFFPFHTVLKHARGLQVMGSFGKDVWWWGRRMRDGEGQGELGKQARV